MATLFILNDPPYGTERVYNGLRLATNLLRLDEGHELVVFLMGDAASAAKSGQVVPNGYYNVSKMLGNVLRRGGRVLVCGTCMDARGLTRTTSSTAPTGRPWTNSPGSRSTRTRCWCSDDGPVPGALDLLDVRLRELLGVVHLDTRAGRPVARL